VYNWRTHSESPLLRWGASSFARSLSLSLGRHDKQRHHCSPRKHDGSAGRRCALRGPGLARQGAGWLGEASASGFADARCPGRVTRLSTFRCTAGALAPNVTASTTLAHMWGRGLHLGIPSYVQRGRSKYIYAQIKGRHCCMAACEDEDGTEAIAVLPCQADGRFAARLVLDW
jgi:hypothetical protein